MTDRTLIIFTKDRIDRLDHTLPHLPVSVAKTLILDDSLEPKNRQAVADMSSRYGIDYHGPTEQQTVLSSLPAALLSFVQPLGTRKWSLGFNRNYALIYSLCRGSRFLIMMDDDVLVRSLENVEAVFAQLQTKGFAAANIELMPDDSIVGHIYRQAGVLQTRYASGTFLGIDLHQVSHFFFNNYNEDWIWLFLENNGAKVPHPVSVDQLRFDPFFNLEERSVFQEEGEILWEGIYRLQGKDGYDLLTQPAYWVDVLGQRKRVIQDLTNLSLDPPHRRIAVEVRKCVLQYHATVDPMSFARIWREYQLRRHQWLQTLRFLRRGKL